MTGPMSAEQVARRRAVEALRSGVPSWDAVAALGSGQGDVEDRFGALLDTAEGGTARGLLLGGGFGAGKSHLLTHLAHLALERGFAVSTVVVSKETPLHDPAKVHRAAVESLVGPDRRPGLLADAAAALDPDSAGYAELRRWVQAPAAPVDERFAATLLLHEKLAGGEVPDGDETVDAVVRFWAGDPIRVPELRRALKTVGAGGLYSFGPVPARELARQRMRFTARLLRAAGHAGWVVLFDEVELIGRYSLLQRGRSYAELARWAGGDPDDPGGPVAAVLAMTDDFEAAVLTGKDDRSKVPAKLRDKQTAEWDELAGLAERGIRAIERDLVLLAPPDAAELDRAYRTLKALHAAAYDWSPPDVPGLERLGATRMRQYVRAWINAWDLVRLDPQHAPDTEVVEVRSSYDEDEEETAAG
ncbi:MAG TPA: BREX system ATP-binding domain-containing protein [Mycobacteriales bacterium]|nr:BREX system ATP-binding domain-containing protein [Mycobacteriales bacterium]